MSDEIRTISVRFTLDEDERSTVLMDLTARADDVLVLVSVRIRPDGRLSNWTKWEEGLPRLIRWDASARRIEEVPLLSGIRLGDRPGVTGDLLAKMAAVPLCGGGAGGRFLRPEEPS
ncbi:hypothetical protein [Nonomuraea sp. NPDC002799]